MLLVMVLRMTAAMLMRRRRSVVTTLALKAWLLLRMLHQAIQLSVRKLVEDVGNLPLEELAQSLRDSHSEAVLLLSTGGGSAVARRSLLLVRSGRSRRWCRNCGGRVLPVLMVVVPAAFLVMVMVMMVGIIVASFLSVPCSAAAESTRHNRTE